MGHSSDCACLLFCCPWSETSSKYKVSKHGAAERKLTKKCFIVSADDQKITSSKEEGVEFPLVPMVTKLYKMAGMYSCLVADVSVPK